MWRTCDTSQLLSVTSIAIMHHYCLHHHQAPHLPHYSTRTESAWRDPTATYGTANTGTSQSLISHTARCNKYSHQTVPQTQLVTHMKDGSPPLLNPVWYKAATAIHVGITTNVLIIQGEVHSSSAGSSGCSTTIPQGLVLRRATSRQHAQHTTSATSSSSSSSSSSSTIGVQE